MFKTFPTCFSMADIEIVVPEMQLPTLIRTKGKQGRILRFSMRANFASPAPPPKKKPFGTPFKRNFENLKPKKSSEFGLDQGIS